MFKIMLHNRFIVLFFPFLMAGLPALTHAENPQLSGHWIVNHELSDDTDIQVEKAIKEAGGKIRNAGKGRGRHKGGPPEQELYDHISYDEVLKIQQNEPRFEFSYDEGFARVFYSDNRGRSVSASSLQGGERHDYAFAYWEGNKLMVEARVRDGGKTIESYHIDPATDRLHVQLEVNPLSFLYPVEIVRIYERVLESK